MMNLLAIETSADVCSVGLALNGNRFSRTEHVDRRHNEHLLPMLTELRERSGCTPQEFNEALDGVAFGRGPGSFTGVRIAAAAAQAIARAAGARMFRVDVSSVLALQAVKAGFSQEEGFLTSIHSRRDLFYLAAHRIAGPLPELEAPNRLFAGMPERSWLERYAGWRIVGRVPPWWEGGPASSLSADADAILDLAQQMAERGEDVPVHQGLPEYPEGDAPWRKSD
jgi:tRNA threonylcarbamoyladenosine biosynthesis protein TsaB